MKEHYFSEKPTSEFKLKTITETIRGKKYAFNTAPGVFSATKIDFGTKLLAEKMRVGENDRALDLGCGIGVIGRVTATLTNNKVVLTDINQRACKLAKTNTKELGNTKVVQGDKFQAVADEKFDAILLNPPQTAGKKLCFEMIEEAKEHLNPEGTLQLVARHNKGGKTLSEKMQQVFGNLETIAKQGGYRVYLSKAK